MLVCRTSAVRGSQRCWPGVLCITLLAAFALGQASTAADDTLAHRLRARLASGELRWGGDAEGGAPYQFRDPRDPEAIVGFEVDLIDALCERLSARIGQRVAPRFKQYEWVNLGLGLEKRDFDLIVSGFEATPERRASFRLSRPYYVYTQQLVVRAEETKISSVEDCRGRTVGTLAETTAERLLRDAGIERIRTYDGQVEPFQDLAVGRLDAVLLDLPICVYYAGTDPRLKFVGPRRAPGHYVLAARPDDADLIEALNAALHDLYVSGQWQALLRKWQLWNAEQAALGQGDVDELRGLGFGPDGVPRPELAIGEDEAAAAGPISVAAESARHWTFDRYAPLLLRAAGTTVFLTVTSMAVAMAWGLVIAVVRLYAPPPLNWLALSYVEFFRGIPLLLLLVFLYFGLPHLPVFPIELSSFQAAILGFGLNYAAYEAEIYRSALASVPRGQWEAGQALGMSNLTVFRRIVFPQALRTALGPVTNDFVAMFKDTSLVSVIAVQELTKEYQVLAKSSLKFLELGLLTAALYLAMSVPLGYLSRYLERRWGGPHAR